MIREARVADIAGVAVVEPVVELADICVVGLAERRGALLARGKIERCGVRGQNGERIWVLVRCEEEEAVFADRTAEGHGFVPPGERRIRRGQGGTRLPILRTIDE